MPQTVTSSQLEDIQKGLVFAFLSITDDSPNTLENVGKSNPWQIEGMRIITGSEKQAFRPLTEILKNDHKLEVDKIINVTKVTPGGQLIDTQGYIAHDQKTIVLAYRCTTSVFDWIVNFNTTSSVWEIEEDLAQGFSGYCSCLMGICQSDAPRVHTGFYNNFLASLPFIKEVIEPMLGSDQPPRKLYVVGHSLGAGIASLAACYFLLHYDWNNLPHSFVNVTAGSPRVCGSLMQEIVHEKLSSMNPQKAAVYRLVKGSDVVASVPPSIFNFKHLVPPIEIQKPNDIIVLVTEKEEGIVDSESANNSKDSLASMTRKLPEGSIIVRSKDKNASPSQGYNDSKYDQLIAKIPEPLRDHMPEFYLKPVYRARGVSIPAGSISME